MTTNATSEIYTPSLHSGHHHDFQSAKSSFSRRGSEASASLVNGNPGFFDHAPPTMRMEAFIGEEGGQRPRGSYRTRQGRKKDMGYWGVGERSMRAPGVDLPDEVVNRSRSPTVQSHYPAGGSNHNLQVDGVSIMSEENFEGKRHVIQEDLAYDIGPGGNTHFRGF
jgi:hypothetical protein